MDAAAVREAAARIAGRVHRTPVLGSATLEERTGARLAIKNEAVQRTGSFKARGALNRLLTLDREALARGLVGVSAGNHAAALAWAAAQVGAKATVVMPVGANARKVAACRGYGAKVVLHGDTTGEAFAECERLRRERGLTFVHPFDDPMVLAGQGTAGLELAEDAGPLDLLVVPVGGGGLISGMALAVRAASPSCRVVGVEPDGAATLRAALAAGEPVPIVPQSVADGLCAPFAGRFTLGLVRELVDDLVTLSETELLAGTRFVLERMKVVAEPAGAAAVGALLAARVPGAAGARVGAVISGGNLDLAAVVPMLPDDL
ncbi:MAG TPA: threonine/serine dehydratase [Actinomycetes bacterium]|nr:threonine/serine dehydratase [Actinomycetes bacterium]